MKNTDNQVVTRKILKEELSVVRKELKKYATKKDMDYWMERNFDIFLTKDEFKVEMNKIANTLDYLVKSIDDLRADNAAHIASYSRLEAYHINHEGRIVKIENHLAIS